MIDPEDLPKIDNYTIPLKYFNLQEIIRHKEDLKDIAILIYVIHSAIVEYKFFSRSHGKFTKIDHIWATKYVSKVKMFQVINDCSLTKIKLN